MRGRYGRIWRDVLIDDLRRVGLADIRPYAALISIDAIETRTRHSVPPDRVVRTVAIRVAINRHG